MFIGYMEFLLKNNQDIPSGSTSSSKQRIKAEKVQLITQNGENIGIVSRVTALSMAQDVGLDLVILTEEGKEGVPVVKIMDLGKDLYEKKKKQADAKKNQKIIQVKEVKIRPKIADHDYETKMKQILQFLNDGKRVKVTLWFKGRENITKDVRGAQLFDKLEKDFEEHGYGPADLISEKDGKSGLQWARIYYLKKTK